MHKQIESEDTGLSMEDAVEAMSFDSLDELEGDAQQPEDSHEEGGKPEAEPEDGEAEDSEGEEPKDESEAQEPEEAEEELSLETLDQLAEALDMPLDEFLGQVKANVTVNGERMEVTLSEALKGHQREADYSRKTMELAEMRREHEAQAQAQADQLTEQHHALAQMIQMNEQMLMGEFQSIDWNELAKNDPAQAALQRQLFHERAQQIEAMKRDGMQQWGKVQQETEQKALAERAEFAKKEAEALLVAIPEWASEEVAETGKKEVVDYLMSLGVTPEEIGGLIDHRQIVIARKAMLFDRMQKDADVATKKVRKLPKLSKSGKSKTRNEKAASKRNDALKRFKKTRSVRDAALAIPDDIL